MARATRFDIRQAAPRIALVLGLLAALNLAFYALLVRPSVQQFERQEQQHQPVLDALAKRRAAVEKREAFVSGVHQAEADLKRLREEVLSSRNVRMIEAQAELARLATEFNIDLNSVGYGNELLLDEELERFAMSVPLVGSYQSLRKFLQAVEQSDKFLVVERVALARDKQGGNQLNLSISLATYFNAPPDMVQRSREGQRPVRKSRS
jgi:Tfp pilus assembly protein PilO